MKLIQLCTSLSICICLILLLGLRVIAAPSDIKEIYKLLQQGNIEGYNTIITPLKGDPSHFNIKPTDDIKNIQFGKGIQGYTFNFDLLEQLTSSSSLERDISNIIIEKNQYYFPIIISGRNVGLAEIENTGNKYKVISMSSGSLLKHLEKAKVIIGEKLKDTDVEMYYIEAMPYFNGYLIKRPNEENFVSIENLTENKNIPTFEVMPAKVVLEEVSFEYKKMKSTNNNLSGGGISPEKTSKKNYIFLRSLIALVVGGLFLLINRRMRFGKQN